MYQTSNHELLSIRKLNAMVLFFMLYLYHNNVTEFPYDTFFVLDTSQVAHFNWWYWDFNIYLYIYMFPNQKTFETYLISIYRNYQLYIHLFAGTYSLEIWIEYWIECCNINKPGTLEMFYAQRCISINNVFF